jgi:hypothetical protein
VQTCRQEQKNQFHELNQHVLTLLHSIFNVQGQLLSNVGSVVWEVNLITYYYCMQ